MARQRRGEPGGQRRRRRRGLVAGLLVLTLAAACDSPRRGLLGPGVAGTGSSGALTSIAGTWRRTLVVTTSTDVITSETTWIFTSGGGCERTVVTNSVLLGFPETQRVSCTYQMAGNEVRIQFPGSQPVSFTVALSAGRLFLGGVEFQRIG